MSVPAPAKKEFIFRNGEAIECTPVLSHPPRFHPGGHKKKVHKGVPPPTLAAAAKVASPSASQGPQLSGWEARVASQVGIGTLDPGKLTERRGADRLRVAASISYMSLLGDKNPNKQWSAIHIPGVAYGTPLGGPHNSSFEAGFTERFQLDMALIAGRLRLETSPGTIGVAIKTGADSVPVAASTTSAATDSTKAPTATGTTTGMNAPKGGPLTHAKVTGVIDAALKLRLGQLGPVRLTLKVVTSVAVTGEFDLSGGSPYSSTFIVSSTQTGGIELDSWIKKTRRPDGSTSGVQFLLESGGGPAETIYATTPVKTPVTWAVNAATAKFRW